MSTNQSYRISLRIFGFVIHFYITDFLISSITVIILVKFRTMYARPHKLFYLAESNILLRTYVTSVKAKEWERPTHKEERIITLEGQVKQLEANAASCTSNASPLSTPHTPNIPGGNARNIKPPWMAEPPSPGDPQKKAVKGKDFHLCPNHLAWVRHLPSQCEGKCIKPSAESKPASSTPCREAEGSKEAA